MVLSRHDVVQPDAAFVATPQRRHRDRGHLQGPPTLVVEVVSDPRTDRVRKRGLYACQGMPEHWIVDPDADRLGVYRLEGSSYSKPSVLEVGDALASPSLSQLSIDPNTSIDVAGLLAR